MRSIYRYYSYTKKESLGEGTCKLWSYRYKYPLDLFCTLCLDG